MSNEEILALR
jgi:hypothetical protein